MNIITKIKNLFSSKDILKEPTQISIADDLTSTTSETIEEDKPFSEPEPVVRRVLKVQAIENDLFPPSDDKLSLQQLVISAFLWLTDLYFLDILGYFLPLKARRILR